MIELLVSCCSVRFSFFSALATLSLTMDICTAWPIINSSSSPRGTWTGWQRLLSPTPPRLTGGIQLAAWIQHSYWMTSNQMQVRCLWFGPHKRVHNQRLQNGGRHSAHQTPMAPPRSRPQIPPSTAQESCPQERHLRVPRSKPINRNHDSQHSEVRELL